MTPQELAALPKGTRVRFSLAPFALEQEDETDYGHDLGTIVQTGAQCSIQWGVTDCGEEEGTISLIDTLSKSWTRFIEDISLDTPPPSV